jgi:hypothetical protein
MVDNAGTYNKWSRLRKKEYWKLSIKDFNTTDSFRFVLGGYRSDRQVVKRGAVERPSAGQIGQLSSERRSGKTERQSDRPTAIRGAQWKDRAPVWSADCHQRGAVERPSAGQIGQLSSEGRSGKTERRSDRPTVIRGAQWKYRAPVWSASCQRGAVESADHFWGLGFDSRSDPFFMIERATLIDSVGFLHGPRFPPPLHYKSPNRVEPIGPFTLHKKIQIRSDQIEIISRSGNKRPCKRDT